MTLILKKIPFTVFLMLFLIFDAGAMPPHPSKQGNTAKEKFITADPMEDPLFREFVLQGEAIKQAAPPARISRSGSPGRIEWNIIVILAGFGADLAEQTVIGAPLGGNNIFFNKSGYIFPALLLILLMIQILFKNRKRYVLLNAYLLITLSCVIDMESIDKSSGSPRPFATPRSVFESMLNGEGSLTDLTMRKYWQDMSANNFILNIDVVGPVTVSKGWQYYGRNRGGTDNLPGEFVSEAVRLAHSSGEIARVSQGRGFKKYANFNPNIVDAVIVVFAGPGEENADGPTDAMWSHSWDLFSASRSRRGGRGPILLDGVLINNYLIVPEITHTISGVGHPSVGVFCHEFGHVLGLQDLYDTSGETRGTGSWSLMSQGSWGSGNGKDPAPLLAWERKFISDRLRGNKWVDIKELSKVSAQNITVEDIESPSRTAYKIPLNSAQYLILEGKTAASGDGKKYVYGTGILATHINETIINRYSHNNKVNAGRNRAHGITVVEAAGTLQGGTGYLWNVNYTIPSPGYVSGYQHMLFRNDNNHNKINLPTPGADDNFPNSNYYTSESLASKTGYSGISIEVTSANSVTIMHTP